MKLYHGTDAFFENPDLSMCRPFKDFGRGFYLTPDLACCFEGLKMEKSR